VKITRRMTQALFLFALPAFSAPQTQYSTPARAGDNAAGEIVSRDADGTIYLNTTPCEPGRTIVVFHNPYRMTREESAACRSYGSVREYRRVQVEKE
jgi:hypothetical protein